MDSKSPVRLGVGQSTDVTLSRHGGTGYQWFVVVSNPEVAEVAAAPVVRDRDSARPGDPLTDRFVVSARHVGTATVTFELAQAWQRQAVEERRVVEVAVHD